MSSPTSDRQFVLGSVVSVWMILRIGATVLGLAPWSWWIVVAMLAIAWAFVAWGHVGDAP